MSTIEYLQLIVISAQLLNVLSAVFYLKVPALWAIVSIILQVIVLTPLLLWPLETLAVLATIWFLLTVLGVALYSSGILPSGKHG